MPFAKILYPSKKVC